jgi:hypothetical protein
MALLAARRPACGFDAPHLQHHGGHLARVHRLDASDLAVHVIPPQPLTEWRGLTQVGTQVGHGAGCKVVLGDETNHRGPSAPVDRVQQSPFRLAEMKDADRLRGAPQLVPRAEVLCEPLDPGVDRAQNSVGAEIGLKPFEFS